MITYDAMGLRAQEAADSAVMLRRDVDAVRALCLEIKQAQMMADEADWRYNYDVSKGNKPGFTAEEVRQFSNRDYKDALTAAREALEHIKQGVLRLETDLGRLEK